MLDKNVRYVELLVQFMGWTCSLVRGYISSCLWVSFSCLWVSFSCLWVSLAACNLVLKYVQFSCLAWTNVFEWVVTVFAWKTASRYTLILVECCHSFGNNSLEIIT